LDVTRGTSPVWGANKRQSWFFHAASWDVKKYILSQLQPAAAAAAAGQHHLSQADFGCRAWGPFAASLPPELGRADSLVMFPKVQHNQQLKSFWELMAAEPHCVVLQERVSTTVTAQQCAHVAITMLVAATSKQPPGQVIACTHTRLTTPTAATWNLSMAGC
jgi:hypothetical protein